MANWTPRDTLAVFGAANHYTEEQVLAGFKIGREIARCGKNLLTGATLGVPYAAAVGAHGAGAMVVGISPAATVEEHVTRYKRPIQFSDVIVYTGMGLEGRNAINVRSVKGAIFVAGEFGTLNEFTAAWTTGNNVLGILEGVGGISLYIRDILACTHSHYGSSLVFDSDPIRLVQRVCQEVEQRYSLEGHPPIAEDVHAIIACYLEKESGACLDRTPTTPIGV